MKLKCCSKFGHVAQVCQGHNYAQQELGQEKKENNEARKSKVNHSLPNKPLTRLENRDQTIEKGIVYYYLLLCALFYTRGVAVIIYEAI